MKKIRRIILFICEAAWVLGCSNPDVVPLNPESYFPLRVGDYRVYQVTTTSYNQLTCSSHANDTTKNFFIKTWVTDSAKNAEGGYTYVIQRLTTADTTQAWQNLDTWSARVSANQAVVYEENIPYVKIVFPLRDSTTWNANLYNNLAETDYKLINHNVPYTLANGKKFSTTLSVRQSNTQNLVNKDMRTEVYASSVGLIYRSSSVVVYLTDGNCFGTQTPKTGLDYQQILLRYGHQ